MQVRKAWGWRRGCSVSFFRGEIGGGSAAAGPPFFLVRLWAWAAKERRQGIPLLEMPPHLLAVPFESQRDNLSGTGWRECFSSSAAMLARYWGVAASDDAYNVIRSRYGDTTDAAAQVRALRALGLLADFWTCGSRADIEHSIRGGRPLAVGWLHRGSPRKPTGGHWTVIVGFDRDYVYMHDPNGEPLLATGGHIPGSDGRNVKCSWRNWLPRWEVEGPKTGWYVTCAPRQERSPQPLI